MLSLRRIDIMDKIAMIGNVGKNSQLQIRISAEDKARIQERAAGAGMDVSKWVLNLVLPPVEQEFQALCRELATRSHARSYILAEVQDLLDSLNGKDFERAIRHAPEVLLPPFEANYLAAMIEYAATLKGTFPSRLDQGGAGVGKALVRVVVDQLAVVPPDKLAAAVPAPESVC